MKPSSSLKSSSSINLPSQPNKIDQLHKMLDNEINTVNQLFQKNNAFDQIESKLKQLEVKLNSIKEEDSRIEIHGNFKNSRGSLSKYNSNFKEEVKENSGINMPFESLSHYKKSKKSSRERKNSKNTSNHLKEVRSQAAFESGKKLNFDADEENQENKAIMSKLERNSRNETFDNPSTNRKSIGKFRKSENVFNWDSTKNRSKSTTNQKQYYHEQEKKYTTKGPTLQNSSKKESVKKKRVQSSKSQKKYDNKKQRINSSVKKLVYSKTTTQINSQKEIASVYSSNINKTKPLFWKTNEDEQKNKIKQIILVNEAKKLERELSTYKLKNENLRNKVKELKNYKVQYDKLKTIFQKNERLRKNRSKK